MNHGFRKLRCVRACFVYHSVEISEFFCHSNFPCNQFQGFRGPKNAILAYLEALNIDFYEFLHSLKAEIHPNQNYRVPRIKDPAFFVLENPLKLISRKI